MTEGEFSCHALFHMALFPYRRRTFEDSLVMRLALVLRHEHLNKLYIAFENTQRVILILEYCGKGDVSRMLASNPGGIAEETVVVEVREDAKREYYSFVGLTTMNGVGPDL